MGRDVEILKFRRLGHGYDPTKEEFLLCTPLEDVSVDKYRAAKIGGKEFKVPSYVAVYGAPVGNSQMSDRMSFLSREEYQEYKCKSYNLEAGWSLYVTGNSSGRWSESRQGEHESILVKYFWKKEMCTLGIENIREIAKRPSFTADLASLPEAYNTATYSHYQKFFHHWGTHLVVGLPMGGIMYWNCNFDRNLYTTDNLTNVAAQATAIFQQAKVSAGAGFNVEKIARTLRESGVTHERLEVVGGIPNPTSMKEIQPGDLQAWLSSVAKNSKELELGMQLEAYYNLVASTKREALRHATADYLAGTNNAELTPEQRQELMKLRKVYTRKELGKKAAQEALQMRVIVPQRNKQPQSCALL